MPTSNKPALTQKRLKELLHYDPETGHFTWRRSFHTSRVGSLAGSITRRGYVRITIEGREFLAHRLSFLYMLGFDPPDEVDHVNRNRSDNRWANLRQATRRENASNRGIQSNNTSGFRGVRRSADGQKWIAQGTTGRQQLHLGYFDTAEEAASAAQKWRDENFGDFAPDLTHSTPTPIVPA